MRSKEQLAELKPNKCSRLQLANRSETGLVPRCMARIQALAHKMHSASYEHAEALETSRPLHDKLTSTSLVEEKEQEKKANVVECWLERQEALTKRLFSAAREGGMGLEQSPALPCTASSKPAVKRTVVQAQVVKAHKTTKRAKRIRAPSTSAAGAGVEEMRKRPRSCRTATCDGRP